MFQELKNKRVVVAGLGHFGGGIAVARWLIAQGARVLVTDRAARDRLADAIRELAGLPLEYRLGEHRESDFTSADLIVASPAIPPANEFLAAARSASVPVTTEIRLFIERCPAKILGITGTKGKSTTTAMLGRILARRHTTHVGGNIGKSLLSDLPRIRPDHLVVLELSSFMLEYLAECRWSPHVALVTMIAPDHLDRHKTFPAYLAAKQNITRFQQPEDFAVLNEECAESLSFRSLTPAKIIPYGVQDRPTVSLLLAGRHNQLNAQGALAAASIFGCTLDDAREALRDFRGLPHRLELVHESDGIQWYNDSIATIPEAAVAAMNAFPKGHVIQIVGGSDKDLPFDEMARQLALHTKALLTIGVTGPRIAALARSAAPDAPDRIHECPDLPAAAALARQLAAPGDVILLSTGCASYDQFPNFEARGETFARLARAAGAER